MCGEIYYIPAVIIRRTFISTTLDEIGILRWDKQILRYFSLALFPKWIFNKIKIPSILVI